MMVRLAMLILTTLRSCRGGTTATRLRASRTEQLLLTIIRGTTAISPWFVISYAKLYSYVLQVGMAMSSNESRAYEIMTSLGVDYVLVIFGGMTGYSGDDINKFLWMVRIAEGKVRVCSPVLGLMAFRRAPRRDSRKYLFYC